MWQKAIEKAGVMHLVDTLDAGGAEMMCVQLANALAEEGWRVHVCATRRGGVLESRLGPDVRLLKLNRRRRFDMRALLRLRDYVRGEQIRLLHAHGTSVFLAAAVRMMVPGSRLIWHDHYGRQDELERSAWLYRGLRPWVDTVITVNARLRGWAVHRVGFEEGRVFQIPNFAGALSKDEVPDLPGEAGFRVVQVANVRPQKDHAMMLRAMARIVEQEPKAHLLLVGNCAHEGYGAEVRGLVAKMGLERSVSFLGSREDVGAVLRGCDVGVLSSASEGLPVALLEYGEAGLGVVCTEVGDCPKVLDGCGKMVQPGDDVAMAEAVLDLLRDPVLRAEMGERLRARVRGEWGREAAVRRLKEVYEKVLG